MSKSTTLPKEISEYFAASVARGRLRSRERRRGKDPIREGGSRKSGAR
jgi:hypothetical protein